MLMKEKLRILVVEDEEHVADLIAVLFARLDWDVEVATTGKKGLELATEEEFDLITLDVGMPDISGVEICRELRQRHISYRTPVVFVSAHSEPEIKRKAFEFDAVDFIEKPFKVQDFLARISAAMKQKLNIPEEVERGTEPI
jgi:two-component system alkaline phosphatase synthesis response regulator PhoP